jgi:hypothetical protein
MKKSLKNIISAIVVLFVLQSAESATANEMTLPGRITKVYAGYSNEAVYIRGLENKAECSSDLIKFVEADGDPEKVYNLVLSAFLAGKRVGCVVDGCSGSYQRGKYCYMMD